MLLLQLVETLATVGRLLHSVHSCTGYHT